MEKGRSVLLVKDYGRVTVHLRELMDAQKISRNQMAQNINARFEVVDKWYSGDISRIDADVLARICYALDCTVQDILQYEKD